MFSWLEHKPLELHCVWLTDWLWPHILQHGPGDTLIKDRGNAEINSQGTFLYMSSSSAAEYFTTTDDLKGSCYIILDKVLLIWEESLMGREGNSSLLLISFGVDYRWSSALQCGSRVFAEISHSSGQFIKYFRWLFATFFVIAMQGWWGWGRGKRSLSLGKGCAFYNQRGEIKLIPKWSWHSFARIVRSEINYSDGRAE